MEQIMYLVKTTTQTLTLFARQRERLIKRKGTMRQLFDQLGLGFMHSLDRWKFVMFYRSIYKGTDEVDYFTVLPAKKVVEEVISPIRTISVFLATVGPTPHDVRAFDGQSETSENTFVDGEIRWSICTRAASSKEINVPLSIRALWLRQFFSPRAAQKLRDVNYYEMSLDSYSLWSYPIHAAQISHICEGIPKDSTVVAPGDGIGVVARIWKGSLVAGDRVTTSLTHSSVVEEDLWDTVCRGAVMNAPVFVMSYISTFFSDRLLAFVETTPFPVLVLENKSTCTLRGFTQYGPGLFARNVPASWPFRNLQVERAQRTVTVLYSENLVRKQAVAYYSENEYVKYLRGMRPALPECPLYDRFDTTSERVIVPYSDNLTILCATVRELIVAKEEYPYGQYYFCPIGQAPQPFVEVKGFMLTHTLQRRRIYYTYDTNYYLEALSKVLPTEKGSINGKVVYFFWYPYEKDHDIILDFGTEQSRGYAVVSFSRDPMPVVPIATVLFPLVFVRVPGKTYQVQIPPSCVSLRDRVLSTLEQLPPDSAIIHLVGKTFGVTCEPWWRPIEEFAVRDSGIPVEEQCTTEWLKNLRTWGLKEKEVYIKRLQDGGWPEESPHSDDESF
jgi:hypothetical protein